MRRDDPRSHALHRSGAGAHDKTSKARRRRARQHQRRLMRERREEDL